MIRDKAAKSTTFALALAIHVGGAAGAEIRGTVTLDYQGLFGSGGPAQVHPVSVALEPGRGQKTPPRATHRKRIEIQGNRMRPAFLTVRRGDHVTFVNRDNVYHELFSLSPAQSLKASLGKAGDKAQATADIRLDQIGISHFFCRIHKKSYARIDVVETPYIEQVESGGIFHFAGLAPGPWRLRLAAPAAETRWVDVTAMTSPPALRLTLTSRGGAQAGVSTLAPVSDLERLYQPVGDGEASR